MSVTAHDDSNLVSIRAEGGPDPEGVYVQAEMYVEMQSGGQSLRLTKADATAMGTRLLEEAARLP
ncbi:MAG: hypothetical protein QOH56_2832 [Pseudonocardiales bacterium]|jgi:hypothetical protein|nr:hypothetical protein [Pseudonocardiales bacterium]